MFLRNKDMGKCVVWKGHRALNVHKRLDYLVHYSVYSSFSVSNCLCQMHCFCRAFVPAVLLGEAEPKSNEQSAKAKDKLSVSGWHTTLYSVTLSLLAYKKKFTVAAM